MRVRWNSTQAMLERLIYLQPAINAICHLEDKLRPLQLTEEEWDILNQLKSHLDVFVKATQHLSGSVYPTLSAQLPYFSVLASRSEERIEWERERKSIFWEA